MDCELPKDWQVEFGRNDRCNSRQFGEEMVGFSCMALTIPRLSDSLYADLWEFADMTRRVPASSHQNFAANTYHHNRHSQVLVNDDFPRD